MWIRLRIRDTQCQREYLTGADERGAARVGMEGETLEVVFPFADGEPLEAWFYAQRPDLGQRRDACLSLLAHCIEDRSSPGVLALAAREANLRFSQQDAWLLYLPDWNGWRMGLGTADAVGAVACLCRDILTRGKSQVEARLFPEELRLICLRCEREGYTSWEQLHRDLLAVPDRFPALEQTGRRFLAALERKTRRFRTPAACVLTAFIVLAAALSLVSALRTWRSGRENLFPGVTRIGNQTLIESSAPVP